MQVAKELEMGHHICKQILEKGKMSLGKERVVSKSQNVTIELYYLCVEQMWDFEWTCNRHLDYFDIMLHGQPGKSHICSLGDPLLWIHQGMQGEGY